MSGRMGGHLSGGGGEARADGGMGATLVTFRPMMRGGGAGILRSGGETATVRTAAEGREGGAGPPCRRARHTAHMEPIGHSHMEPIIEGDRSVASPASVHYWGQKKGPLDWGC